jgi:hypothetical protein
MASLSNFNVDLENGLDHDLDDDLDDGLDDGIVSLKDEEGRPRFFGLGMVSADFRREAGADGNAYVQKRSPTALSNSSKRSYSLRPIRLIRRRM